MAMSLSSGLKPRIFPIKGDVADAEIDRAQSIDPVATLNREKVEEIGNANIVGYSSTSPTIAYRLGTLEYGSIEFWQKLINDESKGNSGEDAITLDDFKTPYFDICSYITDDDNTFVGTAVYPDLRIGGFSVTIGDPQARIERSFDLIGESAFILQGTAPYYIYGSETLGSAGEDEIDLSARAPVEDPDNTGVYIYRVVRVRSGVSTELTITTDYTYSDATKVLTIVTPVAGDVIKYWYFSATAPATQFTANTADPAVLLGDSCSIYLYIPGSGKPSSTDYIYRLQSVTIDVRFTREDKMEIGNKNVVQRGISDSTVSVTLGEFLDTGWTIEEVLRGEADGYAKLDVSKFTDEATLIVQFFDDNTKANFEYEIKINNLSPTEIRLAGINVNEYCQMGQTLEGEDINISEDATL